MLTNAKMIKGYKLHALDGELGSVKEFFFDDRFWTVRYLVVNTGSWLNRREVLISPYFLQKINYGSEVIDVNLTKNEIENSPTADSEKPISRRWEESYYSYYGAPFYWAGSSVWGPFGTLNRNRDEWKNVKTQEESWDPNLRSSKDVTGNNIQATNEEIGHVDDFIIDDENWTIRYFVVDTRNFLPGKKVLISPQWVDRLGWEDSKVFVNLTSEAIRNAPEYDPDNGLTRDYETRLYSYYNREGYWKEPVPGAYTRSGRI